MNVKPTPQMLQKFNIGMYNVAEADLGEAASLLSWCNIVFGCFLMFINAILHYQNDE